MKKFITFFLLCLLMVSCNPKKKESDTTGKPVTYEIQIQGMHCTGCENAIKSGLMKLKGITEVKVSYIEGFAVATNNNPDITKEEIKNAIEKKGYKVQSIEIKH